MKKDFLHSTVFKITALLFCISFMSVVSMFSSVFISDNAEADALAVNVAGSLRMQSFRMMAHVQQQAETGTPVQGRDLQSLITQFETQLNAGTLKSPLVADDSGALAIMQRKVAQAWYERVKPELLNFEQQRDRQGLLITITEFVDTIDALVGGYQQHAEANIAKIRLIQSVALFVTVLMTAVSLVIINRQIEKPLSHLKEVAKRIGRGDYTAKAEIEGKGELQILAEAMNGMSQSIYRSQSYLEEKVRKRTEALRASNASLQLLFKTSRMLNDMAPGEYNFDPIISQLSEVTNVEDLDLCVMTPKGNSPFMHLTSLRKSLPERCLVGDCSGCTNNYSGFTDDSTELKYHLVKNNVNYGVLIAKPKVGQPLLEWQHQLFESLAEQIATGLGMLQQQEQGRRIALMSERTVIARELHDSLAQALSYLKIQVARLQKMQKKENPQEHIDEVVAELRTGLDSAYRELRELLTTFRLKLDGDSLRSAFDETVQQLQTRSNAFAFEIDYAVDHVPFSPQEEIHMLQIAREAMQNAFYHSKGSRIVVSLREVDKTIVLTIADNGVGIPDDPNKLNHYGLAIIQERSRSIGGEVHIGRNEQGGTDVVLQFTPEYQKSIHLQAV